MKYYWMARILSRIVELFDDYRSNPSWDKYCNIQDFINLYRDLKETH
jgi:hypothetical protein